MCANSSKYTFLGFKLQADPVLRQWTSKTYDFDRTPVPLPPLIDKCSREAVRSVPWKHVFRDENIEREIAVVDMAEKKDWRTWASGYEPEAGVINFVSPPQLDQISSPLLTQFFQSINCTTPSRPTSTRVSWTPFVPSSASGPLPRFELAFLRTPQLTQSIYAVSDTPPYSLLGVQHGTLRHCPSSCDPGTAS